MRLKEDTSSWRSSGIVKRDFRHDHSDMPQRTRNKKDTTHWCRGKIGVEHVWRRYLRGWHYKYIEAKCMNCGKRSYNKTARKSNVPLQIDVEYSCYCEDMRERDYKTDHNVIVRKRHPDEDKTQVPYKATH